MSEQTPFAEHIRRAVEGSESVAEITARLMDESWWIVSPAFAAYLTARSAAASLPYFSPRKKRRGAKWKRRALTER
jgi:hypothetical protein